MSALFSLTSLVIAVQFGAAACGSEESHVSRDRPKYMVNVEPSDLATAIRGIKLRAVVGITTLTPPDEAVARDLLDRFAVVDDQGNEIELRASLDPEIPSGGAGVRYVNLTETNSLSATWYEVIVDLKGLDLAPHPGLIPNGDGTYSTRFHPDSAPVLRALSFCPSQDGGSGRVALDFSEPVNFVPDDVGLTQSPPLSVGVDGVSCQLLRTVSYVSEEDRAGSSVYNSHFELSCATSVLQANVISVTLLGELKSASGKTVQVNSKVDGAKSLELRFAEAYESGDCSSWRLP